MVIAGLGGIALAIAFISLGKLRGSALFCAVLPAFAAMLLPVGALWPFLGWTMVLVMTLAALSSLDHRTGYVPDLLTIPLLITGLVHAALVREEELAIFLLIILAGLAFALQSLAFERFLNRLSPLGGGDALVILAAFAWLGPEGALNALAAALTMVLIALIIGLKRTVRFIPFLAFAIVLIWCRGLLV